MNGDDDRISLNDLPQWSAWPCRLLGLEPWAIPSRTIEKISREYDQDKYARSLRFYLENRSATIEQVRQFEISLQSSATVCISEGDVLRVVDVAKATSKYSELLLQQIAADVGNCNSIVELGAGYGYNLWLLQKSGVKQELVGGEYCDNALQLGSYLFPSGAPRLAPFNFYDPGTYKLLDEVSAPILIFTSHAIEQLPSAGSFLDALRSHRKKIIAVVHCEPLYEAQDQTMLGLMRRRYCEMNDYNRDLLSQLQRRSAVTIVAIKPNVLGLNPLNPTSIVRWRFAVA